MKWGMQLPLPSPIVKEILKHGSIQDHLHSQCFFSADGVSSLPLPSTEDEFLK
jgi:hypothetical protein